MRRSEVWPAGTPCWLDIMTPDVPATQRFYGELFGWSFRDPDHRAYFKATRDDLAVAGVFPGAEDYPPVWSVYLAVDDVDASGEAVVAAGGEIVVAALESPGGRVLVCRDPTGAVLCLVQSHGDIGCEIANEPGTFVWSELLTRDYAAAKQFYADVLDLGVAEIGGGDFEYATLDAGGNVVGGVGPLPADVAADVRSHWRVYFAAADIDATVAAATALGASVTIPAHDTPFGRWAGLADPLGAQFCVITPPA